MLNTDTVTVYKKNSDGSFTRHIVSGVQWSDHWTLNNVGGRVTSGEYTSVTFFEGTYEGLDLPNSSEEDAIFYGVVGDEVVDGRISALLKAHPKSGVIKSVNDNSNRDYLKNIKVVLA